MEPEQAIRAHGRQMADFQAEVKEASRELLAQVAKVAQARGWKNVWEFRAELPVVLSVVGRVFEVRYKRDIVRAANNGAKLTEKVT